MTIISFKHRFIFFKTEKVAGTSLEIALSHFCGKDDIMSAFAHPRSNRLRNLHYPYPVCSFLDVVTKGAVRKANIWSSMPAQGVHRLMGGDVFRSFLKISSIRNPYDRVVSLYAWRHRRGDLSQKRSVSDFREWFIQHDLQAPHAELTIERPYDAVDVMIRFEHFEEDLTALSRRLGLTENIYDTFKEIRENSGKRPKSLTARACFEGFPEGIEKVKRVCATALETFGYDLPWLPEGPSGGLSAEDEQQV